MSIVCAVAAPGRTTCALPFLDHVSDRRSEKIRGERAAYHTALVAWNATTDNDVGRGDARGRIDRVAYAAASMFEKTGNDRQNARGFFGGGSDDGPARTSTQIRERSGK